MKLIQIPFCDVSRLQHVPVEAVDCFEFFFWLGGGSFKVDFAVNKIAVSVASGGK